jgi:integrase
MTHTLKLFRRHDSNCTGSDGKGKQPYPKEFRIYESDSPKTSGRRQCDCTISAEGRLLKSKLYVRPKSTGQREWDEAHKVADQWGEWGALTAQVIAVPVTAEPVRIPVVEAIAKFMATLRADERQEQFSQLLVLRLIPFVESAKLSFIQDMDDAEIWSDFKDTWKNDNPLRNRKEKPGQPVPILNLRDGTTQKLITDLRIFQKFCVKKKWLSENWAARAYMSQSVVIEQKESYSDEELDYIYRAATLVTDGKGFTQKRTGQQNSKEVSAFIMALDNTGLRLCDTVRLERHQLVPFNSPPFKHAIYCSPQKTRKTRTTLNFVHIPIAGIIPGLRDLAKTLEELPTKQGRYFFLGGKGTITTNVTSWKARVVRVLKIAEDLMNKDGKRFSFHPHPHRFRHTFACRLLAAGMPTRLVAQYLGDTEETVRKHYSKFCVAEQHEAAGVYGEAMLRRAKRQSKRLQLVKA